MHFGRIAFSLDNKKYTKIFFSLTESLLKISSKNCTDKDSIFGKRNISSKAQNISKALVSFSVRKTKSNQI